MFHPVLYTADNIWKQFGYLGSLPWDWRWTHVMCQTSLRTCIWAIRRRDIIALPFWQEQHLSLISQGFWLRVCPLSLTRASVGLCCGKGCWGRGPMCKILCSSELSLAWVGDEVGRIADVPCWGLPSSTSHLAFPLFPMPLSLVPVSFQLVWVRFLSVILLFLSWSHLY